MGWTEERVAELKRLHRLGFAASHIAAELGGISRNAVLGKIYRLGLATKGASKPGRLTMLTRVGAREAGE